VRRRPLNLLTLLSLLLCIASAALWVRAHFVRDAAGFSRPEKGQLVTRALFTGYSVIGYTWSNDMLRTSSPRTSWFYSQRHPGRPQHSRVLPDLVEWVELHSPPGTPPSSVHYTVPLWMFVIAFGAAPAVRLRRSARARRLARRGHCPRCAYDLTGDLSGVCPECGAPAGKPAR
jgi:hypothetical protein